MKRFLSILLAVMMIASVAVVAASATGSDRAIVTLVSAKGESVTKSYAVGETFTATVYLNAGETLNGKGGSSEGRIGSMNANQTYDSAILELAEEYDPDEGMLSDLNTIFPITKENTTANGGHLGSIYYNATIPSYSGFLFNSDDSVLIKVRYTVKAAGQTTIENAFTTLAIADFDLTRIVDRGVEKQSNFTSKVDLSDSTVPADTGFTLSGTVTSYTTSATASDAITLTIVGSETGYTDTVTVSGTTVDYSFADVPADTYSLTVAKENHVTRQYDVPVSGNTAQDVKICPKGDTNLNGRVQSNDAMAAYKHAQGNSSDKLEGYAFECADVNGNGRVQSNDAMTIYQQAQGNHTLF